MTKLGRLVKAGKIKSMEEIYLHSLPIKEYQIVDFFLPKLKDEVMKVRIFIPWNLLPIKHRIETHLKVVRHRGHIYSFYIRG